jgi:hypothetical protein
MLGFLAQTVLPNSEVPVPESMDWVPALLLTIVWIFVAAAVFGSVKRFWEHQRRT